MYSLRTTVELRQLNSISDKSHLLSLTAARRGVIAAGLRIMNPLECNNVSLNPDSYARTSRTWTQDYWPIRLLLPYPNRNHPFIVRTHSQLTPKARSTSLSASLSDQ